MFALAVVQATELQIGIDSGHHSVFAGGHIHIYQLIPTDEVKALVIGVVAQIFHRGIIVRRANDLANLDRVLKAGVIHHVEVRHGLITLQLRGGVEQVAVAVSGARKGDYGVINKLTIIVGVAGKALPLTAHECLGGAHQGGGGAGERLRDVHIIVGGVAGVVHHSQLESCAKDAGDIQPHPALSSL